MKLICMLVVLFTLGAQASGYAQNVNISMKNAKIEHVLKEISKQTKLRFFYDEKLLEQTDLVDVSVSKSDVRTVLNRALKGQNLAFEIMGGDNRYY